MPANLGPKSLKLKKGGIVCKAKGGTSAVCWKDKDRSLPPHRRAQPPATGHFVKKEGNASKPLCIESYNKSMGFVDFSDMIAIRYSISRNTWKWPKKLFFHLFDRTILNAFIIHKS
ncbi:hypothetical protein Cfor_08675 [Coptotermes formosanus]|jgi:hypothetical protein|uniref:PiggyBac transposable element-derived protein domain-containing protein n=1 Tax=Coptotermes formosanus TaxID=36987 RepID=A0A6L2Q281_COPFO|nr:hypothetical protein Cfor_08675 [Coptotermes formosanus]